MFRKPLRVYWAVSETAPSVPSLDRGSVAYERIAYMYLGDILNASLPGDYVNFGPFEDQTDQFGYSLPALASGPVRVDQYPNGGLGAYIPRLRQRVAAAVVATIQRDVPGDDPAMYTGLFLFDLEDWRPFWRRRWGVPGDPEYLPALPGTPYGWSIERFWRRHIRDTRPQLIAGLSGAALEDVFEQTYIEIARPVHDAIYEAARAVAPNAKFGEWAWPERYIYELSFGDPRGPLIQAYHDRYVPRMAQNWDYLSTWLYASDEAVPPGQTPNPALGQGPEEEFAIRYGNVCREARRLSALCGGLPIIPHICAIYDGLNPLLLFKPTNVTTARLLVHLLREYAFDGAIMWGSISPGTLVPSLQVRNAYQAGLNIMQPMLRQFIEESETAFLSSNSPVAIGTIP